jgi:hypothetical protein
VQTDLSWNDRARAMSDSLAQPPLSPPITLTPAPVNIDATPAAPPAPVPFPAPAPVPVAAPEPVPVSLTPIAPVAIEPEPVAAPTPAPVPLLAPEPVAAAPAPTEPLAPAPAALPEPDPEPEPELAPLLQTPVSGEPTPPPAAPAAIAPSTPAAFAAPLAQTLHRVRVRLTTSEAIEVAAHEDETAARGEATALMRYLRDGRGDWPYLAGRYVRPETIVSIDVDTD